MAVIKFDPNVPVEVALKYDSGRRVESRKTFTDTDGKETRLPDQMLYTVCGDDTMYLPLHIGEMIDRLGIKKLELVSICKRVKGKATKWEVKRVGDTQTEAIPPNNFDQLPTSIDATPIERQPTNSVNQVQQRKAVTPSKSSPPAATPAPIAQGTTHDRPIAAGHTHASLTMAASYIAIIDAMKLAEQYATSKGIPVKPLVIEFLAEDVRAGAATIYIQACKDNSQLAAALVRNEQVNGGTRWPA